MALTDKTTTQQQTAHFCPQCGHEIGPGVFCPGCGYNTLTPAGVTGAPSGSKPSRSRVALIAVGALIVVAVAIGATVVLSGSGSGSSTGSSGSDAAYRAKLTTALAPLISANQPLSSALGGLDGSQHAITVAQNATSAAQSALTAARGAVAVLSAPNSDATLSQEVQQALTDENGYLQGISSTLTTPVGNSAATLQPLATSAQSALVPLASVAPGASNSLSGTSNLISWSNGAASAATRAHDAAQQQAVQQAASNGAQHGSANSASSSAGSSSSSAGGASTGLTSCDQNISAGADTSCPLAENTFYVFSQSPEQSGETISVYSPTSGNTYALTCTVNGLVDCAGQASTVLIQFPFQAALDYTPAQAAAYAASAQLGDSNPNG